MSSDSGRELLVVGLGPGTWESLTQEVASILTEADEVYVRTGIQPPLDQIRSHLPAVVIHTFDRLYESLETLPDVYRGIVEELADLVSRCDRVVYAVPGSPSLGESTVGMLIERFRGTDVAVRLVQGLSYVEGVLAAVGCTDASWLQLLDAGEIALLGSESPVGLIDGHDTPMPWRAPLPVAPLLISSLYDGSIASAVKLWLGRYYPDEHQVRVVQAPGTAQKVLTIPLHDLDHVRHIDHQTTLYVPPLEEIDNVRTFTGMMQLTRRLRGPGGCPWDREQTNASLKPYLLEEAYEVLEALDSGDPELIAEEFGDLLYQISIHAQVGAEAGLFTVEDIIQNIMVKLIGRHPHVFGDMRLDSAQDVRHAWESFKQRQKPRRASVLEEIPRGLPALPQSNLMQKRAASIGFEWPAIDEVFAKLAEELGELHREIDGGGPRQRLRDELGDIFFVMVSVARHLRLDPEEALRLANRKFATRFSGVEQLAAARGLELRALSLDELDVLWREAKQSTAQVEAE